MFYVLLLIPAAYLAALGVSAYLRRARTRRPPPVPYEWRPIPVPDVDGLYPDGAASPWEPPEPVTTGALRRLLAAPGDGAEIKVRYDGEGKWREN